MFRYSNFIGRTVPITLIKRIFFFPAASEFNRYVAVERELLRGICANISSIQLAQLLAPQVPRRDTAAILNWYEDQMGWYRANADRVLVKAVLALVLLKLRSRKIIWVRHNFWPLDLPKQFLQQRILLFFLDRLSTVTVTHRKVDRFESVVVPHPLYTEDDLPASVRDIEYLYFGVIKQYKGLDTLLEVWPKERRLVIAGAVRDEQLYAPLQERSRARGLSVDFIGRFLPDAELDALLLRTKYVVLPHQDDAMIVTGAFYHAVSFGANVVARNGDFGRAVARDFNFVNLFDEGSIDADLTDLRYVDAQNVVSAVRATNGSERCREAWSAILQAP